VELKQLLLFQERVVMLFGETELKDCFENHSG